MIAGWVDFERVPGELDARGAAAQSEDGRRRIAAAGLEVAVDGAEIDVHVEPSFIAVACGRPRFEDRRVAELAANRGTASAWCELVRTSGAEAPAVVKGHYALAAIDLRERRVTLATDRFATFPLCYGRSGSRFAFADRADSVPLGSAETVDPQAIFDYLYFHVIPAPRTVFKGVHRLEGGHAVIAEPARARRVRYWTPRFTPIPRPDPAALAAEFRDLVRQAVASEADVDSVGCFLSGGTDSSTVAGMLGVVKHHPARTFSIGFDAVGYDEMEYARIAVRHFGTRHREHYLTTEELIRDIPAVAAHYDQPFGNSSALAAYQCARVARQDGVTKLLAGDGGDELFGGNTRYAKQKVFALYEGIPQGLRTSLIEPMLLDAPLVGRLPLLRKAASYVRQARLPMPDRMETYNLLARLGVCRGARSGFPRVGRSRRSGTSAARDVRRLLGTALVDRMLEYDWKYTLADNDLPKVRGTAALAGMEVRISVPGRRGRRFFAGATGFVQGPRIEAAAVLQGGVARLPAGPDHREAQARIRIAVRSVARAPRRAPSPGAIVACTARRAKHRATDLHRGPHRQEARGAARLLRRDDLDPDNARAVACRAWSAARPRARTSRRHDRLSDAAHP